MDGKEKVLVSACLYGVSCRWHGKKCYKSSTVRKLEKNLELIPVCPEMLGGLPCPRLPVKIKNGRVYQTNHDRSAFGLEVTDLFQAGAEEVLRIAAKQNIMKAYLFKLSPSCALNGITGKYLRANGIEVIPIW